MNDERWFFQDQGVCETSPMDEVRCAQQGEIEKGAPTQKELSAYTKGRFQSQANKGCQTTDMVIWEEGWGNLLEAASTEKGRGKCIPCQLPHRHSGKGKCFKTRKGKVCKGCIRKNLRKLLRR